MIVSYLFSKSTLSTFLVAGLALLTVLPTRAWANGIDSELLWNFLVIGLAPTPLFPHPKVI